MPRPRKEKSSVKPLSELERKIKEANLENEMLAKANKERKRLLDEAERIEAQERQLTAPDEAEADDSASRPFGGRQRFMSPQGLERQSEETLQKQEAFESILADFASGQGKVEVYRLKDGTYAKMASIDAKDWGASLETVAKKFGGGTFKVRLRDPDGVFAGETICHYDEEAYPKPSSTPSLAPAQQFNPADIMRVVNESNEKSNDRMMMMMKTMMESMAAMNGGKSSMLNNMSDLMAFKEMLAEKKKPTDDLNNLISVFTKGMELASATAPAEEGSIIGSLLGKILNGDTIGKVATAIAAAASAPRPMPAAAPAQRPVARPVGAPAPAQAGQPQIQQRQEDGSMNWIVSVYKPVIVNNAKANTDPRKMAEQIVARIAGVNDGYLLIVDDYLKMPTTKDEFIYKAAPELREFDGWVDAVMANMQAVIAEVLADDGDDDGDDDGSQPDTSKPGTDIPEGEIVP